MAQRADIARARKDQAAKNLQTEYRDAKKRAARMDAAMAEAGKSETEQPAATPADAQARESQRFARSRALAQSVWHASIGAAVTARHRSGKLFHRLVEKGTRYQYLKAQSQQHNEAAEENTTKPSAAERMHELEHRLEDRLDKGRDSTLHWIGVPSCKEFEALQQQVEQLRKEIDGLQQQQAADEAEAIPRHL